MLCTLDVQPWIGALKEVSYSFTLPVVRQSVSLAVGVFSRNSGVWDVFVWCQSFPLGFTRGPKHSHHIPSLLRSLTFSFLRRVHRSPQYLSPDPAPSARSVGFLSLGMGRERGRGREIQTYIVNSHTYNFSGVWLHSSWFFTDSFIVCVLRIECALV